MPKVIADITMSLDGFVTGEGADRGLTTLGSGAGRARRSPAEAGLRASRFAGGSPGSSRGAVEPSAVD